MVEVILLNKYTNNYKDASVTVGEPIKLGNAQLVIVDSLWVLTQLACSENE